MAECAEENEREERGKVRKGGAVRWFPVLSLALGLRCTHVRPPELEAHRHNALGGGGGDEPGGASAVF